MFDWIDPFIWQLFLVPLLTISAGVIVALRFENAYLAPLVTLVFNVVIELAIGFLYDPYWFHLSSWNLIFPVFSFPIAYTLIGKRKIDQQMNKTS